MAKAATHTFEQDRDLAYRIAWNLPISRAVGALADGLYIPCCIRVSPWPLPQTEGAEYLGLALLSKCLTWLLDGIPLCTWEEFSEDNGTCHAWGLIWYE